jgi:hypothetical protein
MGDWAAALEEIAARTSRVTEAFDAVLNTVQPPVATP